MLVIPGKETLLSFANSLCFDRFKPGIDGVQAKSNYSFFLANIDEIIKALNEGTYCPKPALSFAVLKKNGRPRELSRFCAQDVVIQRALAFQITEELKDRFSVYSFAYLPGRGVRPAIEQFLTFSRQYGFVSRIDPVSCYDRIDRSLLSKKIRGLLGDSPATDLIMKYAEVKIADEKGIHDRSRGILQGSPLSPVLCNVFFDSLDRYLEEKNVPFCRYADDIVVFAGSFEEAKDRADIVTAYLTKELRLDINTDKFLIAPVCDTEYLGHTFMKDGHGLYHPIERSSGNNSDYTGFWVRKKSEKNHRTVNILSDGILTRKEWSLCFESGEISTDIPRESIDQINVYSSVIFAPGVVETAFRSGVSIGIFDRYGHLTGRFLPSDRFHNVNVSLNQLEIYRNKNGLRSEYARDFLLSQLHNIRLNLRYQRKQYENEKCSAAIRELKTFENQIKACSDTEEMLLLEARIKKLYYGCFDQFIRNEAFVFQKRSKRPPRNEINALLSFANVFLYNYISREINKTPLDVRIAFLHSTTIRSESLNLDLADVYKPLIVDRTVFTLVNKRMITPDHFSYEQNGGVYLTAAGKNIVLTALYEKLEQTVPVHNEHKPYYAIIRDDIRALCADVKAMKKHKSFRQVR